MYGIERPSKYGYNYYSVVRYVPYPGSYLKNQWQVRYQNCSKQQGKATDFLKEGIGQLTPESRPVSSKTSQGDGEHKGSLPAIALCPAALQPLAEY